ncbi:MAG: NAD(P)-binding protein [Cytophagia bacterium]|nr:NAD(P)-binding protein [Cytophagia bacterium]
MDIIVGAGVTGLSYACFCGHDEYKIIEKDTQIGGYCKTIKQDGFTWDYSGHFFHFNNDEIKKYLLERMQHEEILSVIKNSQIQINGYYVDFPFQKNIHQLSKEDFIKCLYHLYFKSDKKERFSSFKEMIYAKFGQGIAELFLIPYNEKLYACDLEELDVDAMGRFFPYADIEEIIRNFQDSNNTSYNSTFLYPKNGAIAYINSLYSRVIQENVSLSSDLEEIDLKNKRALINGSWESYDRLISTMPFPKLLDLCQVEYDKSVYSWNKVLVYNLGFHKKGKDTTNHWVYFPERKYCFYRIGYYDNIFGSDRMSLYVELGFKREDEIDHDYWLQQVLEDLKNADVIQDHELVSHVSLVMDPAYVHVKRESEEDKIRLMNKLEEFGVYSAGRYGGWRYCSIEDNIIESKVLAKKLNG